jgi:phage shock protein A
MHDRVATMMIVNAIRDVVYELKAVREELHRLNSSKRSGERDREECLDRSKRDDA